MCVNIGCVKILIIFSTKGNRIKIHPSTSEIYNTVPSMKSFIHKLRFLKIFSAILQKCESIVRFTFRIIHLSNLKKDYQNEVRNEKYQLEWPAS